MSLLILGILLWSGVHLVPAITPTTRSKIIDQLGENPYKGIFTLLIISSIVLMVLGWRSIPPTLIYTPSALAPNISALLVLCAFILFASSHAKTNIKRLLRHPQLTGVFVWSAAHILANGDNRSLVLFGSMGLWAIAEIVFISRREGEWIKPEPVPVKDDALTVVKGTVVFIILLFAHTYLTGVALI